MDIFGINVFDVAIVLLILCCGVVGLRRGVFKELIMTVGYLILMVVSLVLMKPIAEFLSLNLPFFNFTGSNLEGLTSLNIILYQVISFITVFAILGVVFNIILGATKVLEKLLNATVVLGIISKILGFVVGLIEGYILMFIICVVLSYPMFNQSIIAESGLKTWMLNNTPGLSGLVEPLEEVVDEIVTITEDNGNIDADKYNCDIIDIMLNHDLVSKSHIEELIKRNKLTNVDGIDDILGKYE